MSQKEAEEKSHVLDLFRRSSEKLKRNRTRPELMDQHNQKKIPTQFVP